MASTYLAPTCKPWLRFHRDTRRVNESSREAREHFASRLKAWVRFRPRMFFFVFKKMKRKNTPRPSEHPPVMEEKIFRDNKSKY